MDWKNIIKKLLYPPLWQIILLAIFSTAALILLFTNRWNTLPIAYAVYMLSFYSLCIACIFCIRTLPMQYKKIRQKVGETEYGSRYMSDAAFRTHISLYLSLAVNLLYAGINLLSFVLYRSVWFFILAAYYAILVTMRFLLLRYMRNNNIGQNRLGECRVSTLCAVILLTMNFVLSGAVFMILYQDKGFAYHGTLIYAAALHTFYTTIRAVIGVIRHKKYASLIITTTKIIALSAALVSMLSLETAMFSQFGTDMAVKEKRLMIALTGAGVSVIVIIMSVYIIVQSSIKRKKLRSSQNGKSE